MFTTRINSGDFLSLTEADKNELRDLVSNVDYSQNRSCQDEVSINQIFQLSERIPRHIREKIINFSRSSSCYLWLRNLPNEKQNELLLVLTCLLGFPIAHVDEGELVMSAKPKIPRNSRNDDIAYYTWNKFDLHTELSYISVPPDFIALFCVNNVVGGFTYVASLSKAIALIEPQFLEQLEKSQFTIPVPNHFGKKQSLTNYELLNRQANEYSLRVRFDGLRSNSKIAEEAAQKLQSALDTVREAVELSPGDLLLINNRNCAHGRAPFSPTFDKCDRELKRVYLTTDLDKYGTTYNSMTRRISMY